MDTARRYSKNVKRSPALADVARLAGVSTATVSRCLNAPHTVREQAREKVHRAITKLGYVPHGAARALAAKRSGTVGAIVPTLENSIFAKGIHSLQGRLAAEGFTLLLASSNYDLANEIREARALVSRGVDGMVLVGTSHRDEVYSLLKHKSIPYVTTWCFDLTSPHPCVGFDNRGAAFRITRYLLDLGHRRIGVISGILKDNDRASERVAGIQEALAERGLTLRADWLLEGHYSITSGRTALRQMMSRPTRPTAVVCGNDVLALGAILEAQALGIAIPGMVSITGFDDLDLASQIAPALTTAHVPVKEMGEIAAEYLLATIQGGLMPEYNELEVELVVRQTTGPVHQSA